MKFCWTTLHVKDLEVSLKFYTEIVGLKVNRRFKPNEMMELAFLGEAPTELELIHGPEAPGVQTSDISIGFMIEGTLEEVMETLKANGYTEISEIHAPNPVMRFFYVKDPDGFSVQFIEDMR